MKRILKYFFIILNLSVNGQTNLVPNWSFENYDTCPDQQFQLNRCTGWMDFRNGAEYFNACCGNDTLGVPDNFAGHMEAASGSAYAEITAFTGGQVGNYKNYLGDQLISPLVIGTKYYVSFKVSPTLFHTNIHTNSTCQDVCNKLGAFFTTVPYNSYANNSMPIPNYAHVYTDSVVKDTAVWTTIRGSFIPDSAYRYVVIGIFFEDSLLTFVNINPSGDNECAAYYLDNVCVSIDSMYCETLASLPEIAMKRNIIAFPNPCSNELTIKTNLSFLNAEANIYDIQGRIIFKKEKLQSDNYSLDVHALNSGMYLLYLKYNDENEKIIFIKN